MKEKALQSSCPVCKLVISKDDDRVVCPDCGTPYHRICYNNTGSCVFKDDHGKNIRRNSAFENDNAVKVSCKSCGMKNPEDNIFCGSCGAPLQITLEVGSFEAIPNIVINDDIKDTFDTEIDEIEGISKDDYTRYIGNNSEYFIPIFSLMEKENVKATWNWSAFLGGPFYFFYRKMYSVSIPLFIFYAFFGGASLFYYTEFTKFTFINALENIKRGVVAFAPITIPDNILWISQFLYFLRFFIFIVMIICGLFTNIIYKDYVLEDITKAKELKLKKVDYYKYLRESGGTNLTPIIIMLSVLATVIVVFLVFTTMNIYNNLF